MLTKITTSLLASTFLALAAFAGPTGQGPAGEGPATTPSGCGKCSEKCAACCKADCAKCCKDGVCSKGKCGGSCCK
jgi:hypothetical protein